MFGATESEGKGTVMHLERYELRPLEKATLARLAADYCPHGMSLTKGRLSRSTEKLGLAACDYGGNDVCIMLPRNHQLTDPSDFWGPLLSALLDVSLSTSSFVGSSHDVTYRKEGYHANGILTPFSIPLGLGSDNDGRIRLAANPHCSCRLLS